MWTIVLPAFSRLYDLNHSIDTWYTWEKVIRWWMIGNETGLKGNYEKEMLVIQ